jgi:hypothetical protein
LLDPLRSRRARSSRFDLRCSFSWTALLVFPHRSAWAEFVTADLSLLTLERSRVHSDDWFAVAVLAIPGKIRRTPVIVKNGCGVYVATLQSRADLKNFLEVVWSWCGHRYPRLLFLSSCASSSMIKISAMADLRRFLPVHQNQSTSVLCLLI